jgi:thiamine-monophosphate kinase
LNKEDYFISLFNSRYIGDDGAVINDLAVSKDLFCEDVHFKRKWMSLEEIAVKSVLVNISDAIVMNAKPLYLLLGVKIPKDFSYKDIKELQNGFGKICKEYEIDIIGGDTISGDKLDISVTLISKCKRPVRRIGIKKGFLFAYTGTLGSCKKELKKLQKKQKIYKNSKFVRPRLRAGFFYEASRYISSALDISDGLYKDLSRLTRTNRIGVRFFKKFPKDMACSGEEYEILFAFDKRYKKKILSIAKKHRVPLDIFAKAKRGKFKNSCKENHF